MENTKVRTTILDLDRIIFSPRTENADPINIHVDYKEMPFSKYTETDEDTLRLHTVIPALMTKYKRNFIESLATTYLKQYKEVETYFEQHPEIYLDYDEYLNLEKDPWSFDPNNYKEHHTRNEREEHFSEFKFKHDDVRMDIFEEEKDLMSLAETIITEDLTSEDRYINKDEYINALVETMIYG